MEIPTLEEIHAAALRIRPWARRTPVLTSSFLDEQLGGSLFFKCECFQKAGAFKFRGACNAVFSLGEEEARRGVVTHSSGNHAQALALAAKLRGVPAWIVMPRGAPRIKAAAVEGYGGRIVWCEPTLEARERTAADLLARTGGVLVHPYDDPRVIAGQGTAALELVEETGPLDVLLVPVGGGGLASGSAIACAPATRVFGVEPETADDARRSLALGELQPARDVRTVADGLRTALSARTFAILRRHLAGILTSSEASTVTALRLVLERMKIVIEPSSAVPLGALLEEQLEVAGLRVGVILSGGNLDLDGSPWKDAGAGSCRAG